MNIGIVFAQHNNLTFEQYNEESGLSHSTINSIFQDNRGFIWLGTDDEKGTGLGLSMCKVFAEKYEGKIWIESVEGEGSTFSFSLPVIS